MKDEKKCGYCRRKREKKGNNLTWCKRHGPRVTVTKIKFYSEEDYLELKTQLIDLAVEVVREWAFEGSESGEDYYCFEPDEPSIEKAFRRLYDNKIIKNPDRVYVREIESYEVSK